MHITSLCCRPILGAMVFTLFSLSQAPAAQAQTPPEKRVISEGTSNETTTTIMVPVGRLTPGKYGWTELMEATLNGDEAAVKRLLAQGVGVNARDDAGTTALMLAAEGHAAIARLLLDSGAQVNVVDENGRTALGNAVDRGHPAIAQLLLDSGADPNAHVSEGTSVLEDASRGGFLSIVRDLIDKGVDLPRYGGPALLGASWKGHTEIVTLLLAQGADVNFTSKHGTTALHLAAKEGHRAIVSALIDKGVDLRRYGGRALLAAVSKGHVEPAQLLLANGVDARPKDRDDKTALMYAAANGSIAMIQALLARGAVVNAKYHGGRTPLSFAARKGHDSAVKFLLEHGAQEDATHIPMVYADLAGHTTIVKTLLKSQPIERKPPGLIFFQNHDCGCDLNLWDPVTQKIRTALSFQSCPEHEDVFVSDFRDTIFIARGETIQEIVLRPEVIKKSPFKLPFKIGEVHVDGKTRWNSLYRAGYLGDGRLAVVKESSLPFEDSYNYLYALEGNEWALLGVTYCHRYHDYECSFHSLNGRRFTTWRDDSEAWHPMLYLNPFVIARGIVKDSKKGLDVPGQRGMRFITFRFHNHESTLFYSAEEGELGVPYLYTSSLHLQTYRDTRTVELCAPCETSIGHKYLLFKGGNGLKLIDLETGEQLLGTLEYATWVH